MTSDTLEVTDDSTGETFLLQEADDGTLTVSEHPKIAVSLVEYDESDSGSLYNSFLFYTSDRARIVELSVEDETYDEVYNWIYNHSGEIEFRQFLYL
jgi:hypothetical protein